MWWLYFDVIVVLVGDPVLIFDSHDEADDDVDIDVDDDDDDSNRLIVWRRKTAESVG